DADLRIVQINRMFADLSDIRHEGCVGNTLEEVLPTFALFVRPLARIALDTGKATPQREILGEALGPAGDSRRFASWWPLRDGERVVGVGVRIHQAARHGVEDVLRRNEAQFRAICEACPVGIFLTDEQGFSLYSNPVHLAQMGCSLRESRGHGWEKAIH